ncbi:unnamed protein product [Heligmosomoides polygyrus]|uniref:Uncharacterized protein n=1 Tax=Heligmosomoides polygyrus TaxID=6339 RepID=A0A183G268_HELPZ|nr:unnamed protein product [Heligmosomoides polygyrus]
MTRSVAGSSREPTPAGWIASLAVNAGRRCEPTEASRDSSRLSSPESSRGSVNKESPSTCSDPSIRLKA